MYPNNCNTSFDSWDNTNLENFSYANQNLKTPIAPKMDQRRDFKEELLHQLDPNGKISRDEELIYKMFAIQLSDSGEGEIARQSSISNKNRSKIESDNDRSKKKEEVRSKPTEDFTFVKNECLGPKRFFHQN